MSEPTARVVLNTLICQVVNSLGDVLVIPLSYKRATEKFVEMLLAWHLAHQPPTLSWEKVDAILLNHGLDVVGVSVPMNPLLHQASREKLTDRLLTFALPPPVSREDIEAVLKHWIPKGLIAHPGPMVMLKEEFVDALLALLRLEEPRRWCPHWVWEDKGGGLQWYRTLTEPYERFSAAFDDADICPVKGCHAPRPAGT